MAKARKHKVSVHKKHKAIHHKHSNLSRTTLPKPEVHERAKPSHSQVLKYIIFIGLIAIVAYLALNAMGMTAQFSGAGTFTCGTPIGNSLTLPGSRSCEGLDGIVTGADGITIDCQNNKISGNGASGKIGIKIVNKDVTVKNCIVESFETGISIKGSNANVQNNEIRNGKIGIVADVNDWIISDNKIRDTTEKGIWLKNCQDDTEVNNNDVRFNGEYGIYVDCSADVTFNNNVVNNNKIGLLIGPHDDGVKLNGDKFCSNSYADIISNSNGPQSKSGIYCRATGEFYSGQLGGEGIYGACITLDKKSCGEYYIDCDYTCPKECGYRSYFTEALSAPLENCERYGVSIEYPNIVFDCNKYAITGTGTHSGVVVSQKGATVQNCDISGFNYGVHVSDAADVKILNSNLTDNDKTGILIDGTSTGTILDGNIIRGNNIGVKSTGSADSTTLKNSVDCKNTEDLSLVDKNTYFENFMCSSGSSASKCNSACPICGDNTVNSGESCDGTALANKDCKTQGFESGTLKCKSDCTFDTSSCYKCGDGKINQDSEVCDKKDLSSKTCASQGYSGGTLGCSSDCKVFDISKCYNDKDSDKYCGTEYCPPRNDAGEYMHYEDQYSTDCNDSDPNKWQNETWYQDADKDGYGDSYSITLDSSGKIISFSTSSPPKQMQVCSGGSIPTGYADNQDDCAPEDSSAWNKAYPVYFDDDFDGHGDPLIAAKTICIGATLPSGWSEDNSDCNDNDASVWNEIGGYTDNDGDGIGIGPSKNVCAKDMKTAKLTDKKNPDGSDDCNDTKADVWRSVSSCVDKDGDGYGVGSTTTTTSGSTTTTTSSSYKLCVGQNVPSGYTSSCSDCDDTNKDAWQLFSIERYLAANPDVNKSIADADPNYPEKYSAPILYVDKDNDTYSGYSQSGLPCIGKYSYSSSGQGSTSSFRASSASSPVSAVPLPPGVTFSLYRDCEDTISSINPGKAEICDGKDNNCNGQIDEGVLIKFYRDGDGDGFGTINTPQNACIKPTGYVLDSTDCNDSNKDVWQLAQIYPDLDKDGYGAGTGTSKCIGSAAPTGFSLNKNDCNDNNNTIKPTAAEVCDGVDNDCSGVRDDNLEAPLSDNQQGVCKGMKKVCADANSYNVVYTNITSTPVTFAAVLLIDDHSGMNDYKLPAKYGWIEPKYADFSTDYQASETRCTDLLDNDCDGKTDAEDSTCFKCTPGDKKSCYTGVPETSGIGVCKNGTQTCASSGVWGTCENETIPSRENCGDSKDNDCNGKTDLADPACLTCTPRQTISCYEGTYGTNGTGPCKSGTKTCQSNRTWSECVGQVKPSTEKCDKVDNDCDGKVDEDACKLSFVGSEASTSGKSGDKYTFTVEGKTYSIEFGTITATVANFKVASGTVTKNIALSDGQNSSLDMNADGFNEVTIAVDELSAGSAEITITKNTKPAVTQTNVTQPTIVTPKPVTQKPVTTPVYTPVEEVIEPQPVRETNYGLIAIILLACGVALMVLGLYFYQRRKPELAGEEELPSEEELFEKPAEKQTQQPVQRPAPRQQQKEPEITEEEQVKQKKDDDSMFFFDD